MKRIVTLFIMLAGSVGLLAQNVIETSSLSTLVSTPLASDATIKARDRITLSPGFIAGATQLNGHKLTLSLDHTIASELTSYLSSTVNDNPIVLDKINCIPGTIGGSINVSPSGAATYQVPIQVSPGSAGMQPNLSIVYSSQSGNGLLGWGWTIGGLSAITRINKSRYYDNTVESISLTSSDALALDGTHLISTSTNHYSPANNPYIDVVYDGTKFTVTTQDGVVMEYGGTPDSQVGDSTYKWAVNKITDPNGNYMQFIYVTDNQSGEFHISEVKYTGNSVSGASPYNSVKFYYDKRSDVNSMYITGNIVSQGVLLTRISVFCEGALSKNYEFSYFTDIYSKLYSISLTADGVKYNPTVINWLKNDSYATTSSDLGLGSLHDYVLYSGDLSGDGRTDIVKWDSTGTINANIALAGGGYSQYTIQLPTNSTILNPTPDIKRIDNYYDHKDVKIVDRNNDGKDEVIVHYYYVQTTLYKTVQYDEDGNPYFTSTVTEDHVEVFSFNGSGFTSQVESSTTEEVDEHYFGDFNNDGTVERLVVKNRVVTECGGLNVPSGAINNVDDLRFIDFDGDGRIDILTLTDGGRGAIWEYDGTTFVNRYGDGTTTVFGAPTSFYTGDFNGDGKTDYLTLVHDILYSWEWKTYYSTGIGFVEGTAPDMTEDANVGFKSLSTDDINNDGKSDISYVINGYISTFASNGNDFVFLNNHNTFTGDSASVFLQAFDIDNDGQKEFIFGSEKYDSLGVLIPFSFISIKYNAGLLSKNLCVKSVTDGLGNKYAVTYSTFSDNRLASSLVPVPAYPIKLMHGPMQVVSQLVRTSPNVASSTSAYSYYDGFIHEEGLGFLGFKKFVSRNLESSYKDSTIFEHTITGLTGVYMPWVKEVRSFKGSPLATKTFTMSGIGGNIAQKFFLPVVTGSSTTDYLTSVTTNTTNSYDATLGRMSGQSTTAGDWTISSSSNFQALGGNQSKLTSVAMTRTNENGNHTSTTAFQYDATYTRRVIKKIDQEQGITTDFTNFDSYGNPKNFSVTSEEITRSTSCKYDNIGRFVIESTDVLGNTSKADYRHSDGLKLWEADPLGNTTTYSYTLGSGSLEALVATPDGNRTTSTVSWDETAGAIFKTQKKLNNNVMQTVYINAAGQKVKEETAGYKGAVHSVGYTYNTDGTLNTESYSGIATATAYSYRTDGRLQGVTGHNTSISYSYSGKTQTVIDNVSGIDQTKTFDDLGYLENVTGELGEVSYTYYPSGKVKEITAAGGTTRMEYDVKGNQTKLDDPDAGVTTYTYNGFSQLTSQTDAKQQTTNFVYDSGTGLLSTKTGPNTSESYTYFTTTGMKGILQSATRNNVSETYTYDGLGRVTKVVTAGDSKSFTTTMQYNSIGQLYRVVQPTGLTLQYAYDNAGNMTLITDATTSATIWDGVSKNTRNQWDNYKMGNLVTQLGYNSNYMLNSIQAGTTANPTLIHNLGFNFNYQGQLTSRSEGTSLTEYFGYDEKNRLLTSTVNGQSTFTVSYTSNGNINSTSIAGTYSYSASKPHAVTSVVGIANPTGESPTFTTTSTLTDDNKIAEIDNGTYKNTFTYGPSGNRFKVELRQNSTLTGSKIYVGSNEFVYNSSGTLVFKRTMVYAPTGICAVYQDSLGVKNFYYIHTDYLGSWLKITDNSGLVKNKYSYDAWGRPRNPNTWALLPIDTLNALANLNAMQPRFDRGYTGHEHMSGFGLINMNGRLYDPYLQRFLSPDPFVQAPTNAQNYNRYSYCLNNPLMYTDPSGNTYFKYNAETQEWSSFEYDPFGGTTPADFRTASGGGIASYSEVGGYHYDWMHKTYRNGDGKVVTYGEVYDNYVMQHATTYTGQSEIQGFYNSYLYHTKGEYTVTLWDATRNVTASSMGLLTKLNIVSMNYVESQGSVSFIQALIANAIRTLTPVAEGLSIGADAQALFVTSEFQPFGGIFIKQGPDTGTLLKYSEVTIGAGWISADATINKTRFYYMGNIDNLTVKDFEGYMHSTSLSANSVISLGISISYCIDESGGVLIGYTQSFGIGAGLTILSGFSGMSITKIH